MSVNPLNGAPGGNTAHVIPSAVDLAPRAPAANPTPAATPRAPLVAAATPAAPGATDAAQPEDYYDTRHLATLVWLQISLGYAQGASVVRLTDAEVTRVADMLQRHAIYRAVLAHEQPQLGAQNLAALRSFHRSPQQGVLTRIEELLVIAAVQLQSSVRLELPNRTLSAPPCTDPERNARALRLIERLAPSTSVTLAPRLAALLAANAPDADLQAVTDFLATPLGQRLSEMRRTPRNQQLLPQLITGQPALLIELQQLALAT